jgi:hypothetical protein
MANNKTNDAEVLKYFADIQNARKDMVMNSYLNYGATTNSTDPKKKKSLFKSESEIARDNPSRYTRQYNRFQKKIARRKNRQDNRYIRREKIKDAFNDVKDAFRPSQQQLEKRNARKARRSNLGRGEGNWCGTGDCE